MAQGLGTQLREISLIKWISDPMVKLDSISIKLIDYQRNWFLS